MKKVLFGGFLSLTGTLWGLGLLFIAGNNLVTGWDTGLGRFLSTVIELHLTFPLILSVLSVIAGIVLMAAKAFKKEK